MTFSQFTTHYLANKCFIPAAVAAAIRREAIARVKERFAAARADSVLDFTDLVNHLENAIMK